MQSRAGRVKTPWAHLKVPSLGFGEATTENAQKDISM